jgi:hypothetical protein
MSISNGSNDMCGGLATIKEFKISDTLPEGHFNSVMVSVEEIPGRSFNYLSLLEQQDKLKERFGKNKAYPDPDIDTPWIQSGNYVNGSKYVGPDIW